MRVKSAPRCFDAISHPNTDTQIYIAAALHHRWLMCPSWSVTFMYVVIYVSNALVRQ